MVWKEEFKLPIVPQKDFYEVLAVQAWHREPNAAAGLKPTLIGTARVPIPWAFNGYGRYTTLSNGAGLIDM